MACGALALQKAGVSIEEYNAFEIDKYATKTSSYNFPFIKHHGDVFNADFTQFKDCDILMGGSPCTYWSIAQKNNRETEASGMGWELFSQYVRALREAKPMYFIYENNKSMAKAIKDSISETFGFEPIMINSALVSAQNRQRLYWVGRRNADGTYSKVEVQQPEDRGILLKDTLESGICERDATERNQRTTTAQGDYQHNNFISEPVRVGSLPRPNGELSQSQAFRIYNVNGKSVNITSGGGGAGGKTGLYAIPINVTSDEKSHTIKAQYYKNSEANFVTNGGFSATACAELVEAICPLNETVDGEACTIRATCYKDGVRNMVGDDIDKKTCVAELIGYATPCEWDEDGKPTKAISYSDNKPHLVYKVERGFIEIKNKQYPIKLSDGYYIIRKLTVNECKRLQTVPEWYDFPVSDTQAYKMLGNGWTVDVIAHLIQGILSIK